MKIFLTLLLILNFSQNSFSQTRSNNYIYTNTANEDTIAIIKYAEFSRHLIGSNIDSAYYYANLVLALSEKLNYKIGEIKGLNCIGAIYKALNEYSKAIEYFSLVVEKSKKINYVKGVAAGEANIGGIYGMRGENRKAIEYSFKSLRLIESNQDTENIPFILGQISGCYLKLNCLTSNQCVPN